MHKSRFAGIIIDCETDDLETAADFWSRALGCDRLPTLLPEDKDYVSLQTGPNDPHIEVQRVSHPSRVHLDIETDDIAAEAERLEKLGAKRIEAIRDWLVMEAPTGQRFCLVPVEREKFDDEANVWD